MTFQPGRSGNPSGRPKGIVDKRTEWRELLHSHAKDLIEKLIEEAKAGEPSALRLCIERLLPRIKTENGINFQLPKGGIDTGDNMQDITNGITAAVTSGQMTIDEAEKFNEFLRNQRRRLEEAESKKREEKWKQEMRF